MKNRPGKESEIGEIPRAIRGVGLSAEKRALLSILATNRKVTSLLPQTEISLSRISQPSPSPRTASTRSSAFLAYEDLKRAKAGEESSRKQYANGVPFYEERRCNRPARRPNKMPHILPFSHFSISSYEGQRSRKPSNLGWCRKGGGLILRVTGASPCPLTDYGNPSPCLGYDDEADDSLPMGSLSFILEHRTEKERQ